MRLLPLIAVTLTLTHGLIACTSEEPARVPVAEDSRQAMEAALVHLDQHLKEAAVGGGVLLLEPTSHVWSMESLRLFSIDPQAKCFIPEEMYARVSTVATKEEPITELVSPSNLWLMPAEMPRPDPLMPISELNGVPVSTVVTLSRPGFSENGNEALVILRFTWSIHDALARVRLERVDMRWQIRCAEFSYYV